jgi:hypothetical protein
MNINRAFFLVLVCWLYTCTLTKGSSISRFDYASQIGVAVCSGTDWCWLSIHNRTLRKGDVVAIVFPDKPQTLVVSHVVRPLTVKELSKFVQDNRYVDSGLTQWNYLLEPKMMPTRPGWSIGIAVIKPKRKVTVVKGLATADLDGDGKLEYFRGCMSSEGEHLTVWTGEPLKGKRRFHAYLYLNY